MRESRSSLAGVLLAAAAEGVGVAELVQHVRADGGGAGVGADRFSAANALSRAMPAVHGAGVPQPDDAPPCPLCLLRDPQAPPAITKCASCGEPGPVGMGLCPTCIAEQSATPGAPPPAPVDPVATPPAPSTRPPRRPPPWTPSPPRRRRPWTRPRCPASHPWPPATTSGSPPSRRRTGSAGW